MRYYSLLVKSEDKNLNLLFNLYTQCFSQRRFSKDGARVDTARPGRVA